MIALIDYGGSNLRSVQKALEYTGADVQVASKADEIAQADKLILPGVGAFGTAMDSLRARGLEQIIVERAANGVPLLGICLGMQMLFENSVEMGFYDGLGLIEGRVERFPAEGPKIPHMGWNQIEHDATNQLLDGVQSGSYAYFVHSYYCRPANDNFVVAYTDYGQQFPAIVGRDNVFGIQFHPEKSQQVGLRILSNFAAMERTA